MPFFLIFMMKLKPKVVDSTQVMAKVSAVEVQKHEETTFYHAYLELPDYPTMEIVVRTPYVLKADDLVPIVCEEFKEKQKHCKYVPEIFEKYYDSNHLN